MLNLISFFKQKTAYYMRISDWSSDACSSDLGECRIAPHVILFVERTDDRRNIRLQKARADDDERQAEIECVQIEGVTNDTGCAHHGRIAFDRHADMAHRQQERAAHYGLSPPQIAIGPCAADRSEERRGGK